MNKDFISAYNIMQHNLRATLKFSAAESLKMSRKLKLLKESQLWGAFKLRGDKLKVYSIAELNSLERQPRINDISLKLLIKYYEAYLYPFVYNYSIGNNEGREINIELRFDIDNFCHLVGLEYIVTRQVSRNNIYLYKGQAGWNRIKDGYLDFQELKSINKKRFKSVKEKFVYFYLIPKLISNPKCIVFDKTKVFPATEIECEILFYDTYNNAVVHLGIEKRDKGYYIPRTFLIEKITEYNLGKKYTENQTIIDVEMKNRIIMQ